MPETQSMKKRVAPGAFVQHSREQSERTVQLTQKAIAHLEAQNKIVTLARVCEATREFDDRGKGLQPITILRNPRAAELFRQHSLACQARQQKAGKVKRKRPRVNADVRAMYRGLHSSDLVRMVEDLKVQTAKLRAQQEKLQADLDEARRLRDEALQQNAQQLAKLTRLVDQERLARDKP